MEWGVVPVSRLSWRYGSVGISNRVLAIELLRSTWPRIGLALFMSVSAAIAGPLLLRVKRDRQDVRDRRGPKAEVRRLKVGVRSSEHFRLQSSAFRPSHPSRFSRKSRESRVNNDSRLTFHAHFCEYHHRATIRSHRIDFLVCISAKETFRATWPFPRGRCCKTHGSSALKKNLYFPCYMLPTSVYVSQTAQFARCRQWLQISVTNVKRREEVYSRFYYSPGRLSP